jgi:hypothetical protein
MMSASDDLLRRRARRRPLKERKDAPAPETPTAPLVSQGARTQGRPWITPPSPDSWIRRFRRGDRVEGGWTRLF